MPSSALPEYAKPSAKREHLLDTAERLFYARGYRAVGIDTVLAEAGVAKMTLYNHFASKEELIIAVLERRGNRLGQRLAAHLEAAKSPRQRLFALFDWYSEWFREDDFQGCAMIRAAAEYPDRASPVHQAVERLKKASFERLQNLLADLGVRHSAALAGQLHLLLEGALVRAHTTGDPAHAEVARRAALTLVEAALP